MRNNTIELIDNTQCTGCKVCGDICPVEAITYREGMDGFYYPHIDFEKCIECGLCYRKCPVVNECGVENKDVIKCFGAKSKDENTRYMSTSGGFFSELAIQWINNGGIIVGAEYDKDNQVIHTYETSVEGIEKLRQSKYVQSDTKDIYKKVKTFLEDGKKVLFSGTPCQVEGLMLFLGKTYDNLITMDFVCCGICSPGIYNKYLSELEKKYKSKVKRVWFKNKQQGWRNIGTQIDFENGKKYFNIGSRDLFMLSFVTDALSMRLSCEKCKYRKLPHNSDIMVGDFWGIEKVNSTFDDDKGLSAIMINSKRGLELFDEIKDKLEYFETNTRDISKGNFTIYKPKSINPNRDAFLKCVQEYGFKKAMKKYSSYSGLNKVRTDIFYFKGKIKKILRK